MNNVRTVQNKLKSALGYNVSSPTILNYLAQIGIEAKSLNSDLTDDEINRGVTYISGQIAAQEDNKLATTSTETIEMEEQPAGSIVYSKTALQGELKTMASDMSIELVEDDLNEITDSTVNVFASRKEMLGVLASELKKYVRYQLDQDENAFKSITQDITSEVQGSNAAVFQMVKALHQEVEAGNGGFKRGIDRMRAIFATPTS